MPDADTADSKLSEDVVEPWLALRAAEVVEGSTHLGAYGATTG